MAQQSELSPEQFAAGLRGRPARPQATGEQELSPEEFASGLRKPEAQQGGLGAHLSGAYEKAGRVIGGSALESLSTVPGLMAKTVDALGETMPANEGGARPLPQYARGANYASGPQLGDETVGRLEKPMKAAAEKVYPPGTRGGGLPEQLLGVAGQMLGTVPAAALGGPGVGMLVYGAQNALPAYYDVLKATGGNKEKATKALVFGFATGQLEKLGLEGAAEKLVKRLSTGTLGKAVRNYAIHLAIGGGAEVGTEVVQQGLGDAMHEALTDEDLDNWERIKQVLGPSAIAGTLFAGLDANIGREQRGKIAPDGGGKEAAAGRPVPEVRGGPQAGQEAVLPAVHEGMGAGVPATPDAGAHQGGPQPADALQRPHAAPAAAAAVPGVRGAEGVGVSPDAGGAEASSPSGPEVGPAVGAEGEAARGPVAVPEAPQGEAAAAPLGGTEGASAPGEREQKATSVKNRTVERELSEMGMPAPKGPERTSFVALHEKAMAQMEADRESGSRLVDELETSPRAPSGEEDALLALELNKRIRERDRAEEAFVKDPSEANQARIDKAKEAYAKAADVTKAAGSQSAISLAARKMMIARDYSLAAMERSIQVAKGGEALTKQESAKVKELHEKIAAAEKAHGEYVSKAEASKAELAAENALLRMKKDVGRFKSKKARKESIEQTKKEIGEILDRMGARSKGKAAAGLGGLDAATLTDLALVAGKSLKLGGLTLAQFTSDMVARLGEGIRPYIKPAWEQAQSEGRKESVAPIKKKLDAGEPLTSAGTEIQKIAEGFVADGIHEREPLIDAVHGVVKEADPNVSREDVRDAISGYGVFRKLSKDETKKRLRELKGEMRELARLEAYLVKKKPKATGFERRVPTHEETRLRGKALDLAAKHGLIKKPKRGQRITVSTATEETLRQRKLMNEMRAKDRALRNPKMTVGTANEAILRNRLRAKLKASKGKIRPKPGRKLSVGTANEVMVEAKKLAGKIQARKTRLTNQIEELGERIASKDFGPKPKKETPMDAGAIKLKADYEAARRRFEREKAKFEYANRSTTAKVLGHVKEILIDLPRAIKSSFDLSAPFRQGLIFTVGHPLKSLKNTGRMIQAFASGRKALEIDTEIRSRPLHEFGEKSKLDLTRLDDDVTRPGEEAIQSKWSSKIPGIKASNRAFVTYLNLQRSQNFDLMVRALPGEVSLADGKAIAKFVNIATGRGDFGKFAGSAEGASLILWSPRLLLSRLQLMTGAGVIHRGGRAAVRGKVAKEYARFLIGMTAFYTVARMAQDAYGDDEISVEEDPRSSDFGKIKIGNTRIDPLGGLAQVITLAGRTIAGSTKTSKGEVRSLTEPKFGQDDLTDIYKRFARSKLTPFLGAAVDLRTGENLVGEKVTPASAAKDFAQPLAVSDVRKAIEEQGVPKGAAMSILALFGMGLQTYDANRKRAKK